MFSPSTLELFASLLSNVQLPAASDNFDELAAAISKAKRELAAALAAE